MEIRSQLYRRERLLSRRILSGIVVNIDVGSPPGNWRVADNVIVCASVSAISIFRPVVDDLGRLLPDIQCCYNCSE